MDIQTVKEILKTIIKILTTEATTLLLLILFLATDKILSHIETVPGDTRYSDNNNNDNSNDTTDNNHPSIRNNFTNAPLT